MGNLDSEYDVDPAVAAAKVKAAFEVYLKAENRLLRRRQRDLAVLRQRAGITASTVPNRTKEVVNSIYNEVSNNQ